jgi:hypothetical protein
MPLTVFDIKGVPYTRRERIEQPSLLAASTCASRTKAGSPPIPAARECV